MVINEGSNGDNEINLWELPIFVEHMMEEEGVEGNNEIDLVHFYKLCG